ncbi:MAG: hypothetical protein ACJ72V_11760 [Nitrososphaeraceae archaeon]
MNSSGIIVFFTAVLVTASFISLTVVGPQQAMAKSSSSVMKSLIGNTTRIGVLTMPITCTSLGDVMGALSGVIGNDTAGGNETSSMQGMMASGMQNMSQSKLQHLNTLFCSPASEKMIRSMMK